MQVTWDEFIEDCQKEMAVLQSQLEDCNMPHEYTQFYRGEIARLRKVMAWVPEDKRQKPAPQPEIYPT